MKEFVRISTSYWDDNIRGLISLRKRIQFLKKISETASFLEDCDDLGAEKTIRLIDNLGECEDGIYEVVLMDRSYDYKYKLVKTDISGDLRGNKKGENGRLGYKKTRKKKVKI